MISPKHLVGADSFRPFGFGNKGNTMLIEYEWAVHEYEDPTDDAIDVDYYATFAEATEAIDRFRQIDPRDYRVALWVRIEKKCDWNGIECFVENVLVDDGALPEKFPGGRRVPRRFHAEIALHAKGVRQ